MTETIIPFISVQILGAPLFALFSGHFVLKESSQHGLSTSG